MKRTKVYRPRRGMRFSNGRRGAGPAAGFVAGGPIQRTRPADLNPNSIMVSGSVMQSLKAIDPVYEPFSPVITSSSLAIEGSISKGRRYERRKLTSILLGVARSSTDGPPFPSAATMDVSPTGSFEVPSWAQGSMRVNRSFVLPALTSSDQENVSFNTFTSGAELIDSAQVTSFSTLHYSKRTRYSTITVKKSASFFDTVANSFNSGSSFFPPKQFVPLSGSRVSVVNSPFIPQGTDSGSTAFQPAVITLDVPVSGRLVDIKVWVELQHQSGNASGVGSPLTCLGISLRSPNVSWNGWGTPILNDPALVSMLSASVFHGTIGGANMPGEMEFYRNSFILWEGPGTAYPSTVVYNSLGIDVDPAHPFTIGATNAKWRSMFASWDRDRDMRTVFSDGSPVLNPRMNYSTNLSGNFIGAPSSYAWGNDRTWTGSAGIGGVPPPGWLTGPGGTAAVNEWPTAGGNVGTESIRPMYPLLDPIFQEIPGVPGVSFPNLLYNPPNDSFSFVDFSKFLGFRPGLRGTEISGTWQLMFSSGGPTSIPGFVPGVMDIWFRQARLEITYETGIGGHRFERTLAPRPAGDVQLYSVSGVIGAVSGTGVDDFGRTFPGFITASFNTMAAVPPQAGISRTFGISAQSGVVDFTRALTYRLTGSLADSVGSAPTWLFSGQGGMPIIPESSASLVPRLAESISSPSFLNFIQPRRTLDVSQRLTDIAADTNPQQSLRDLAASFVSSSAT